MPGVSFGTTPPANPVRGHFWWNGVTLFLFDGAVWDPIGGSGGAVTPPGTTFPVNPVPGQQFFNGTTLFIWDGNAWVPVSQTKTYIQATAPPAPNPGDTWFDGTQFWVWSGSSWDLVGRRHRWSGADEYACLRHATADRADRDTVRDLGGHSLQRGAADRHRRRLGPGHSQVHAEEGRYLLFQSADQLRVLAVAPRSCRTIPAPSPTRWLSDVIVCIASTTGGWLQTSGMMQANGTSDFFRAWGWNAGGVIPAAGSNPVFNIFLLP